MLVPSRASPLPKFTSINRPSRPLAVSYRKSHEIGFVTPSLTGRPTLPSVVSYLHDSLHQKRPKRIRTSPPTPPSWCISQGGLETTLNIGNFRAASVYLLAARQRWCISQKDLLPNLTSIDRPAPPLTVYCRFTRWVCLTGKLLSRLPP